MIRVLIERHIAESLESAYEERSRRILQQAVGAPGFISGEALVDCHDPNHRLILANWRSEADWDHWFHSEDTSLSPGSRNESVDRSPRSGDARRLQEPER